MFRALGARLPSLDAARRGHQGSQPRPTSAGWSGKDGTLPTGCRTTMGVITALFAHLLQMGPGRLCPGFLLIRQEVRAMFKTCHPCNGVGKHGSGPASTLY